VLPLWGPTWSTASRLMLLFVCLFVLAPPKFTRTPVDQTGVSGGVASFICQATGDPRPKIVWNKKGKKVSNQRFEVIEFDDGSGSVLRIQPLRTPRDEAIYECVASNSVGEISVSTRLTVLRGKFFFNITNLLLDHCKREVSLQEN
uniref:Ig-like domain-containing protein n=1 Tax=Anser brachyrhynchus TaxID=132585 RepID=A0A8B9BNK8_9AVES